MIRTERDGPLLRLVIDRPARANSLTRAMLQDLLAAVTGAGDASVLVITGTGKVFSAGADLEQARAGLATDPVWEALSAAIDDFPGLSVAALNGAAAGGSLGMMLACDLRVAVEGAAMFYPVMTLGFLPQPSDPVRMAALIGPARTKAILMGGLRVTAAEALAWGLIDRVAAAGGLDSAIATLTAASLAADPAHVRAMKAACRPGRGRS